MRLIGHALVAVVIAALILVFTAFGCVLSRVGPEHPVCRIALTATARIRAAVLPGS